MDFPRILGLQFRCALQQNLHTGQRHVRRDEISVQAERTGESLLADDQVILRIEHTQDLRHVIERGVETDGLDPQLPVRTLAHPAQCRLGLRPLTRGLNFRFPPLVRCGEFPATQHVVAKDPQCAGHRAYFITPPCVWDIVVERPIRNDAHGVSKAADWAGDRKTDNEGKRQAKNASKAGRPQQRPVNPVTGLRDLPSPHCSLIVGAADHGLHNVTRFADSGVKRGKRGRACIRRSAQIVNAG